MRNPYLAAALSSIGRGAALKVQIDPSSSEISQPRATARTNRDPMQPAHPGLTGFLESGYRAPIGQEAQPAVNGLTCQATGSAETAARIFGFGAFVGKTSMDFSLRALRFIVAVCSFFGFNARECLIRPPRISRPWRLRRNCMGVESKLFGLTDESRRALRNCDTGGRPRRLEKGRFTMRS
jgi:hypothetical protein